MDTRGILEAYELSTNPSDNINVYDYTMGYLQDLCIPYGEQINKIGMDHGQYERFDYSNNPYKAKGQIYRFVLFEHYQILKLGYDEVKKV